MRLPLASFLVLIAAVALSARGEEDASPGGGLLSPQAWVERYRGLVDRLVMAKRTDEESERLKKRPKQEEKKVEKSARRVGEEPSPPTASFLAGLIGSILPSFAQEGPSSAPPQPSYSQVRRTRPAPLPPANARRRHFHPTPEMR